MSAPSRRRRSLGLLLALGLFASVAPGVTDSPVAAQELPVLPGSPPPPPEDRDPVETSSDEDEQVDTFSLPELEADDPEDRLDLLTDALPVSEFATSYAYGPDFGEDLEGTRHVMEVSLGPQNFCNAEGVLEPIDPELEAVTAGWVNKAGPYSLFLPDIVGVATPIEFSVDGVQLLIVPVNLSPSIKVGKRVSTSERITYGDAWESTDLRYTAGYDGYKEEMVLKSASAPSTFQFDVTAPGATLIHNPADDSIDIFDDAESDPIECPSGEPDEEGQEDDPDLAGQGPDGEPDEDCCEDPEDEGPVADEDPDPDAPDVWPTDGPLATIPPPIVEDAGVDPESGHGAADPSLRQLLAPTGPDTYRITLSLDPDWLQDPDRVFPVTLDPGVRTRYTGKDAFVSKAAPNRNYGTSGDLKIGSYLADKSVLTQSFLQFKLKNLRVANRQVYGARIFAHAYWSGTASKTRERLKKLTKAWGEGTITWNNRPSVASGRVAAFDGCGSQRGCKGWHRWEGTAPRVFQRWLRKREAPRGFRLDGPGPGGGSWKRFYSSDRGKVQGVDVRPRVILEINDPPRRAALVSPGNGVTVRTESPLLRIGTNGMKKDRNGDTVHMRYQVTKTQGDWSSSEKVADSGWVPKTTRWHVPAGKLKDGQRYWWRVRTSDLFEVPGRSDTPMVRNSKETRSFVVDLDKWGEDDRWAMWSEDLGNDITLSVNEATGNLFLDYPLDSLATVAGPLDLRLTRNSLQTTEDDIDEGWNVAAGPGEEHTSLPVRLHTPSNFDGVVIKLANGNRLYFPEITPRFYASVGRSSGVVRRAGPAGNRRWTYVTPSGGRYLFDHDRNLVEAHPATGRVGKPGFSYEYADGQLLRASDPDGRTVEIAYSSGEVQIQAWDGRVWTATIGDAGIEQVADPSGSSVTFGYDAGNLTDITDGTGRTTTIAYGEGSAQDHQVVTAVTLPGAANATTFGYRGGWTGRVAGGVDVTDPRGVETSDVPNDFMTRIDFNTGGLPIQIAGPADQNGEWPLATQLWDENGNLVCRRTPAANAIRRGCNDADNPTVPEGMTEADGLQTDYEYRKRVPHHLVKETGPAPEDGSADRPVTSYEYDDDSWNQLRADYFDNGQLVGMPEGSGMADGLSFSWPGGAPEELPDEDGTWSMRLTGRIDIPEKAKFRFRRKNKNNDGVRLLVGKHLMVDCWNPGTSCENKNRRYGAGWKDFVLEFRAVNGSNGFTLEWARKNKNNWKTVPAARLEPHLQLLTTRDGPRTDVEDVTTYDYGDAGKVRGLPDSVTEGERTTSYAYDDFGRVTEETDPRGNTATKSYRAAEETDPQTGQTRFVHDPQGDPSPCLTREVDRAGAVTEYACNEAGDVVEETQRLRQTEDADGNPLPQEAMDRTTRFAFDEMGRETRRESRGERPGVATGRVEALGENRVDVHVPLPGTVQATLDWEPIPTARNRSLTGSLAESGDLDEGDSGSVQIPVEGEGVLEASLQWDEGTRLESLDATSSQIGPGATRSHGFEVTALDNPVTADLTWVKRFRDYHEEGKVNGVGTAGTQSMGLCAKCFEVTAPGTIAASLAWDDPLANLDLELYRSGGIKVAEAADPSPATNPEELTYEVGADQLGVYRFEVKTLHPQDVDYTLDATYPVYPDLDLRLRNEAGAIVASSTSSEIGHNSESISHAPGSTGEYTLEVVNTDEEVAATYDLSATYPVTAFAEAALRFKDPGGAVVAETTGEEGIVYLSHNVPVEAAGTYTVEVANLSPDTDVPAYSMDATSSLVSLETREEPVLPELGSRSYGLEAEAPGAIRASVGWEKGTRLRSSNSSGNLQGGGVATRFISVTADDKPITATVDWDSSLRPLERQGSAPPLGSREHSFEVTDTGTVSATLSWEDALSTMGLELLDPGGDVVAGSPVPGPSPRSLTHEVGSGGLGTYRLRVANAGTSETSYTLEGSYPDFADLDLRLLRGLSGDDEVAATSGPDRPESIEYEIPTGETGWYRVQVVSRDIEAAYDLSIEYPVSEFARLRLSLLDPDGNPVPGAVDEGNTGAMEVGHSAEGPGEYRVRVENLSDDLEARNLVLEMRSPRGTGADLDLALVKPVPGGDDEVLASAPDTTSPPETLTFDVSSAGDYRLRVASKEEEAPVVWHLDYSVPGIEWQETTYDAAGRLIQTRTVDGTTDHEYDATGRLHRQILPDPEGPDGPGDRPVLEHRYDEAGNQVQRVDALGRVWETVYDAQDRIIATRDPFCVEENPESDPEACAQVVTEYDLGTNTTTVTDPHGVQTVTTSDLLERTVSERTGALNPHTFVYDLAGNPVSETDVAGVETTRTYDALGQVLTETVPHEDPEGGLTSATTTYDYDGGGNLVLEDGPREDVEDAATYDYDPEGRLTEVTLPGGLITRYAYDDAGDLVWHEDPEGRTRTFTRDSFGSEWRATDVRGTTTTTENPRTRQSRVARPTGDQIVTVTDHLGREVRALGFRAGRVAVDHRFSHDAAGNMTEAKVVDPGGEPVHTIALSYDAAGRLTEVDAEGETTSYAYDKGRPASRTDPGAELSFDYDPNGLLRRVDAFGVPTFYGHDDAGRPTSRTDPTGAVTTRSYDAAGRVGAQSTAQGVTTLWEGTYGYDEAGSVVRKEITLDGAPASEQGAWAYAYDSAGRMTEATDPGGERTIYTWDGAGNRTSVQQGEAPAVETAYDPAGHPVSSTDGTDYTTDPTGALRAVRAPGAGTATYRYDPFGRMNRAAASGEVATYAHDALGRTLSRTQGEETTAYAYSGTEEELARETAPEGETRYANAPSGPLARKVGQGDPQWLLRDVHTDLVGAVSTGGLEASFTWGPWGEPRHASGESTLGFQADPTDPLTGLVDMGARDYHPALGRFTTRDPLFGETKEPLSLNQFLYGLASPLTFYDPDGLKPLWSNASRINRRALNIWYGQRRWNAVRRRANPAGGKGGATRHVPSFSQVRRNLRAKSIRPPKVAPSKLRSVASLSRTAKSRDFHGNEYRWANLAATGVSSMGLGGNPVEAFKEVGKFVRKGWDFAYEKAFRPVGKKVWNFAREKVIPPVVKYGQACLEFGVYGVAVSKFPSWPSFAVGCGIGVMSQDSIHRAGLDPYRS